MWLYAGFLSLGSLAGELREPVRRSYVVALLILIPMVLLVNCMPLMVSMSLGAAPPPSLSSSATTASFRWQSLGATPCRARARAGCASSRVDKPAAPRGGRGVPANHARID